MDALKTDAPLAAFRGAKPQAPDWFAHALAQVPERAFVTVAGARIETLAWGESGRPGLLLLHGNGAHADWYSFIAPHLTRERRVVAMSWSGMGGSDWRETYSRELFTSEALEVAHASGLFAAGRAPVVVGHSFGGRIAIALAAEHGEKFHAAVLVDPPAFSLEHPRERARRPVPRLRELKPHPVYASLEAALARFRFAPAQSCANLFIADYIARRSLRPAAREGGGEGWTWRFDPFLWRDLRMGDPMQHVRAARCPVALIRGADSHLMRPEDASSIMKLLPAGSPFIEIPDAGHHVMVDQPLALIEALAELLATWPTAG
jgi:pimeloyl-ACP methyl ester carboxylesterase